MNNKSCCMICEGDSGSGYKVCLNLSCSCHTTNEEGWEKRFDNLGIGGDTVNGIIEYRGISDNGKCFDEDFERHVTKPYKKFISEEIAQTKKETTNKVIELVEESRQLQSNDNALICNELIDEILTKLRASLEG